MKTITFLDDTDQFRMDPDVKDEWVNALRSGEYIQGQRVLKSGPNSYCCLGVLCAIHGRHQDAFVDFEKDARGEWGYPFKGQCEKGKAYLLPPDIVYEWSGLKVTRPDDKRMCATVNTPVDDPFTVTTCTPAGMLPSLNDSYGFTFMEIADYIEKYL